MKKRIYTILFISILLTISIYTKPTYAQSDNNNSLKLTPFEVDSLKNKLSKIIKSPFNVESNDSNIVISFPQVVKTTDEYLKDQLYVIGNYLVRHKICPETVVVTWKNTDSNYAYKVAVAKEDLVTFRDGIIKLDELYSRMKIDKSETQKQDDTLITTLDKPVATESSNNNPSPEFQDFSNTPAAKKEVSNELKENPPVALKQPIKLENDENKEVKQPETVALKQSIKLENDDIKEVKQPETVALKQPIKLENDDNKEIKQPEPIKLENDSKTDAQLTPLTKESNTAPAVNEIKEFTQPKTEDIAFKPLIKPENIETPPANAVPDTDSKPATNDVNNNNVPPPVKIAQEPSIKTENTDIQNKAGQLAPAEAPEEAAKREDNNKEEPKLMITPVEETSDDSSKLDLKPKISPEGFYTPILKTLIRDDFNVQTENNVVLVNVRGKAIRDDKSFREYAYKIINQVIRVNPSLDKISISWQPEEGAYGKSASIAGIYIKDYFRKKISQDELKEVILVDSIEATSRHLNEVPKSALVDVPIENLRKAKQLREAANIYMENSKVDSAIRTFKQAIKLNPNDFLSYYWLGEAYIKKEEYSEAKEALTKSVSLNPEFRRADEALAKIKSK